ncbi:DUF5362 family protein [Halonotius sp. GCM10025705]|uniref:DUF5362 family protein n=1 Tax=Halonotius sp. GCM10025705 TaxID=3252678 RepID=UPI00361B7D22
MSANQESDVVYCYECGDKINPKAEICPGCGVRQPIDDDQEVTATQSEESIDSNEPVSCGNCEEAIEERTVRCPHCGYSARRNMRKRGIFIIIIGIAASATVYGAVAGVPIILWGFRRMKKATRASAAYTNSKGKPFTFFGL